MGAEQAKKQVKIEWKSTRKIEKCLPEMRHVTVEEAPLQVPLLPLPPHYAPYSYFSPLSIHLLNTVNTWKIQD